MIFFLSQISFSPFVSCFSKDHHQRSKTNGKDFALEKISRVTLFFELYSNRVFTNCYHLLELQKFFFFSHLNCSLTVFNSLALMFLQNLASDDIIKLELWDDTDECIFYFQKRNALIFASLFQFLTQNLASLPQCDGLIFLYDATRETTLSPLHYFTNCTCPALACVCKLNYKQTKNINNVYQYFFLLISISVFLKLSSLFYTLLFFLLLFYSFPPFFHSLSFDMISLISSPFLQFCSILLFKSI